MYANTHKACPICRRRMEAPAAARGQTRRLTEHAQLPQTRRQHGNSELVETRTRRGTSRAPQSVPTPSGPLSLDARDVAVVMCLRLQVAEKIDADDCPKKEHDRQDAHRKRHARSLLQLAVDEGQELEESQCDENPSCGHHKVRVHVWIVAGSGQDRHSPCRHEEPEGEVDKRGGPHRETCPPKNDEIAELLWCLVDPYCQ
mmetsp:Transcript_30592/g.60126  ORF Transcript_30592/g.60126 Transcript_30592/m.60126 type:complete len:201 (-) Transcript_30592:975-1577(-)